MACMPNIMHIWWCGSLLVCDDVYLCATGGVYLFFCVWKHVYTYVMDCTCACQCSHMCDEIYMGGLCVHMHWYFLSVWLCPHSLRPKTLKHREWGRPLPSEPLLAVTSPCPLSPPRPSALPAFLLPFPEPQLAMGHPGQGLDRRLGRTWRPAGEYAPPLPPCCPGAPSLRASAHLLRGPWLCTVHGGRWGHRQRVQDKLERRQEVMRLPPPAPPPALAEGH